MSTKTLRKRIALVAVSAMGFGLLTSVSANAAGSWTSSGSVGLVGDFAGADNLSLSATVLSTGSITVAKASGQFVTVSSGAAITGPSAAVADINGSQNCIGGTSTTVVITPTGAVGTTFQVQLRASGGSCAAGLTGDLSKSATVTIAGASNAGTPSAANSSLNWVTSASAGPTTAGVDDANASSTTRGKALYATVLLKDVYGAAISTKGALTAEVSSGAVVSIVADKAATSKGTYTTAVLGDAPTAGYASIEVDEKTAGTGWSGTLKVSYNGVLVATKSGTITGDISKLTIAAKKVAAKGGTATTRAVSYQTNDSAGNIVDITADKIALSSSSNPAVISDVAATGGTYTDLASTTADMNNDAATSAAGRISATCSTAGKSDVVVYVVNSAGTIVKSNSITLTCGGDAYSYSASFDKGSYVQGEIATLTISFKDAAGNPANSKTAVTATPEDMTISAPMLKQVEADAASKTVDASGNVVYTFTVGTDSGLTAGSYNAVVSFPTVDVPATVSYKVTTGGTSISNAEVLAAIVKLIASINKQITALQKLLTKKK